MRHRRLVLIAALCARAAGGAVLAGGCAAHRGSSVAPAGKLAAAVHGGSLHLATAAHAVRRALTLRGGWGSLQLSLAQACAIGRLGASSRSRGVAMGIFPDDDSLAPMGRDVSDAFDRALQAVRPSAGGLDDAGRADEELFDRWGWRAATTGSGTPYWWRPGEDEEDPEVSFDDPTGGGTPGEATPD